MFKRENIKGFIYGVVITLVMVSTVGVFAADRIGKTIDVVYNNIKLVVEGRAVEFGNDSQGNEIEPFIYNGTTYLPVRSVGEALGKEVDWNGDINTVYIGAKDSTGAPVESPQTPGKEEYEYMTEVIDPTAMGIGVDIVKLDGKSGQILIGENEYRSGYRMEETRDNNYMIFQLEGKYTEIKALVGIETRNNLTANDLNIYLDGDLFKTLTVDPKEYPQEISIPLTGVKELRIDSPGIIGSEIFIADPKIK